ncbi:Na/Pi symporter [Splendidivirga corallicola]|uniref:Na/Pi symporter n=1 Tax=Splendidivirga corallicola TaxID=3051826 RepID=UPI003D287527
MNIESSRILNYLWRSFQILLALFLFFLSINLMSATFKNLGEDAAESVLAAASNPYIGLFIGLLITAIIQSSSTSTTLIVAVVATGTLSLTDAVPMIMGANIGTTLTSTIVALGFLSRKKEFRRAVSAGVIHDFYNILLALVLLPLELSYGILSKIATVIGHQIAALELGVPNGFERLNSLSLSFIYELLIDLINNDVVAVIISFVLLFASIKFLSFIIYRLLIGRSKERFNNYLFNRNLKSFSFGVFLTAGVQSSSITTSLIVPLVAKRKVSLNNAFPFIIGANLGTTLTALLAAMFKNEAAISIALIHLLFNLIGCLIFLISPLIRNLPLFLARSFGRTIMRYSVIGFSYIIVMFFLLPFTLIFINKETVAQKLPTKHIENQVAMKIKEET